MRYWILIIGVITSCCLYSQSNAIYFSGSDFLGKRSYFLNYERCLKCYTNNGHQLRLKGSYGRITTVVSQDNPSEYKEDFVTLESIYLLGKKDHYLELGIGPALGTSDGFDHYIGLEWKYSIGWRLQKGALITRLGYSNIQKVYVSAGFQF